MENSLNVLYMFYNTSFRGLELLALFSVIILGTVLYGGIIVEADKVFYNSSCRHSSLCKVDI